MLDKIEIQNYKSIVKSNMPLGRFNLLIGANGCGKSNVLEAIAIASAASVGNKLDDEFFLNRGIRVTNPKLMLPAFDNVDAEKIIVSAHDDFGGNMLFELRYNDKEIPPRWEDQSYNVYQLLSLLRKETQQKRATVHDLIRVVDQLENKNSVVNIKIRKTDHGLDIMPISPDFERFIIYSLEESSLRQQDSDSRMFPFGRHGEGLLAYLKKIAQSENGAAIIEEIKDYLKILDWFDDFDVPNNQMSGENNILLHDNYIGDAISYFDQRSTNEGFFYLLFYLTLIISDETPNFFAIENIDTSFNPKLCHRITRTLIKLAEKHHKQIIATTHNPAVLDGIDLQDKNVKLHVVRRTVDGYTKINQIVLNDKLNMNLSEAWIKGYIGGLPDNF